VPALSDGNGGPGENQPEESVGEERIEQLDIEDEMRQSYLTYAMSVIVSRALPDVRDGLKPSQRRILVAMNDLNLGPNGSRKKCAKIAGDTSGNYHPHGEGSVYPTLVRMAQEWVMRGVLVDKQGNFGSLAGLPPAAMRYTEARLSSIASEMLQDINRDTVDFVPTYDQENMEPVVLPAKFPNLLVNGSNGIAVGMATSIPPHNLTEVCQAAIVLIDDPQAGIDELMQVMPGPDFPTGGIICGRGGIRQGYHTGRATIRLRARAHFETEKKSDVIVVTEIPYQETRDRIREKLEALVRDDRVKGISRIVDLTDRTIPAWQVRLHIVLKRDADREVVLNQLFRFSPLQSTISVILLALVGNRPETLSIKAMLEEFLRHRVDVIRRRTEFLLAEARKRKHTVEGLMIAQIDIDQIISTIRSAPSRAAARDRLQEIDVPGGLIERALGDDGFKEFQSEHGVHEMYHLSSRQSEAIVSMQLGSLANLEREQLGDEYAKLLEAIAAHLEMLSDEANIRAVIRDDLEELIKKYGNPRRTAIEEGEIGDVDRDDLITEETMVVTLSQRGYIKRTTLTAYQAQNRGGKGIKGAQTDDKDPIKHVFVSSTHSFLLFFTDRGKVYWRKVYSLPQQGRTAKGRALINLLSLDKNESVTNCLAVREFVDDQFLIMATRNGIVKKTALSAYSRPLKGGLIAINLDDGDQLIDVRRISGNDNVVLATRNGMAIRFSHEDARSMGRATRGVKGISLGKDDCVVGMVITKDDMCLLTGCENGFGKRTAFGANDTVTGIDTTADNDTEVENDTGAATDDAEVAGDDTGTKHSGNARYRRQRRGGKGLRDIRTTERNGKVVDVLAVHDDDQVLMVTASGKIQRLRAADISQVGRNTQGVRIIRLSEGDKLVSMARIPAEIVDAEDEAESPAEEAIGSEGVTDSVESTGSEGPASEQTEGEEPTAES
jgi:DNA gyrase subunit A